MLWALPCGAEDILRLVEAAIEELPGPLPAEAEPPAHAAPAPTAAAASPAPAEDFIIPLRCMPAMRNACCCAVLTTKERLLQGTLASFA